MQNAIHKPSNRKVVLVESVNVGLGWFCRDEEGKVFGSKLEDLFNEDGSRLFSDEEIEKRRETIRRLG